MDKRVNVLSSPCDTGRAAKENTAAASPFHFTENIFPAHRFALSGKTVVIIYDEESVEAKQEFKHGEHFYRIIAYAGKLYEARIGLSLSFKIPRAGV
jgi:hypothetical protein